MDLLVWMAFSRLGHGSLFMAYQLGSKHCIVECRKAEPAVQVASYLEQTEGYWAVFAGCIIPVPGRFDILSLSGSFILSEMAGQKSRTGGLSIALDGPGGRVLGGSVAGLLVAASPVQVIVGSFLPEGSKANYMEPSSAPQKMSLGGGAAGTSSLPSRWTLSESSGGPASPLNLSSGGCNNIHHAISGMQCK